MNKVKLMDVLPLAQKYYDSHPGGGTLHIYLDDGNYEYGTIQWCAEFADEQGDLEGVNLAQLLLQLSDIQRFRIYNLLDRSRR